MLFCRNSDMISVHTVVEYLTPQRSKGGRSGYERKIQRTALFRGQQKNRPAHPGSDGCQRPFRPGCAELPGTLLPQGIYRWLRGDTLPSIDNLYAMQGLLGVSVGHILRGNYSLPTPEEIDFILFYQRSVSAYSAALQTLRFLFCPAARL